MCTGCSKRVEKLSRDNRDVLGGLAAAANDATDDPNAADEREHGGQQEYSNCCTSFSLLCLNDDGECDDEQQSEKMR